MEKFISVILPTYNGSSGIKCAIESVLSQSFSNFEIIVIDDGSTDNTKELIFSLQEIDNRIVYVKNEFNLGIQKTLNKGLSLAKGEYIARIDDDDEWIDKDKLKKQVEFLSINKDYLLIGTNAIICDEKKQELGRYLLKEDDQSIRSRMLSRNCFIHPSILASKEAITRVGGYSESEAVKHIEDYELWLKLGCIGKLANINTLSVYLTIHSGSITFKNRLIQARRMMIISRNYRKNYPNFFIGQVILLLRIIGFMFLKFIPFPKKIIYKIQKLYKEY